MSTSLTPEDVARLLQEPSPTVRAEVAAKVAGEIDNTRLTPEELRLAQEIAGLMARDVEVAVRRALAESLRGARRLPRELALRLAEDVDSVALPILTDSPVLSDDDLLQILRHGSPGKQQAIAGRANLAEPVCYAVTDWAGEPAVVALMRNQTAQISALSLDRALDRFGDSDAVKESMVHRAVLPIAFAERLVTMISDQLRDHLVSHHEVSSALASDIVLHGQERAVLLLSHGSNQAELLRLIRQMHRNQRLSASLVLRAICSGHVGFFVTALAVMARVPVHNAEVLVNDSGGRGLISLYEKAGMPPHLLPAVRIAVEVAQGTGLDGGERDLERYRARVISRVLTQYEALESEDLDYLVERLPTSAAL